MVQNLIYKEEAYKIIGTCMEAHTELGTGFSEVIYKDALEILLQQKGFSYEERNITRYISKKFY